MRQHGAMKKCLVTGASGFLGGAVVSRLSDSGWHVVGTAHRRGAPEMRVADLRDEQAVSRLVEEIRPDAVVHCAAARDPDACERDPGEARRLNVSPADFLVRALDPRVPLVFISSDYVFDGERPPYRETDDRAPVNIYGRTKTEAEDIVLARKSSLVLRIPVLVGAGATLSASGFIGKMHETIRSRERVEVEDTIIRFPTWIEDVADVIRFALDKQIFGILHYSGARGQTRYGWTTELARILGASAAHVAPVKKDPSQVARRPRDAHLDTTLLRSMGYDRFTDFAEVMRVVLAAFGVNVPGV